MKTNVELIKELIEQAELLQNKGNLDFLQRRIVMITKKVFGDASQYIEQINIIRFTPIYTTSTNRELQMSEAFSKGKTKLLNLLNVMLEDLEINPQLPVKVSTPVDWSQNRNIFIVHGHNNEMKLEVANILTRLDFDPIILHEQASKGKGVLEKFIESSEVGFAIVLLSGDDYGYAKNDTDSEKKLRARQNVILELGYFIGKLGRERVLALNDKTSNLEIPSDFVGVMYTTYESNGNWQTELIKELHAAGYDVDANKLYRK